MQRSWNILIIVMALTALVLIGLLAGRRA